MLTSTEIATEPAYAGESCLNRIYYDAFIMYLSFFRAIPQLRLSLRCTPEGNVMVVPCPTFPFASVAPVTHKLLLGAKKALPHLGHHVGHRVHHAVHTVARNPQLWIATGCRRLPGALAAIALGVIPPASQAPTPRDPISPAGQATEQSPQGGSAGVIGGGIGSGGGSRASAPATGETQADFGPATTTANLGSTVLTMPFTDVLSPPSTAQSSGRHLAGPYPTGPAFSMPVVDSPPAADPAQSVPEPSSLAVLVAALCGAALIKRRSRVATNLGLAGVQPHPDDHPYVRERTA
jgi:hypothetical protein